jgi:hypothetical protein
VTRIGWIVLTYSTVETVLMIGFMAVSRSAGAHHPWFWLLLLTQLPGAYLMGLVRLPSAPAMEATVYYGGVSIIQIVTVTMVSVLVTWLIRAAVWVRSRCRMSGES